MGPASRPVWWIERSPPTTKVQCSNPPCCKNMLAQNSSSKIIQKEAIMVMFNSMWMYKKCNITMDNKKKKKYRKKDASNFLEKKKKKKKKKKNQIFLKKKKKKKKKK